MALPRKGVDSTVRAQLTADAGAVQQQSHSLFDREPLLNEMPDQGLVLADISGTLYIYARRSNKRYRVALTLV